MLLQSLTTDVYRLVFRGSETPRDGAYMYTVQTVKYYWTTEEEKKQTDSLS